jgi:hypothetical protein
MIQRQVVILSDSKGATRPEGESKDPEDVSSPCRIREFYPNVLLSLDICFAIGRFGEKESTASLMILKSALANIRFHAC